MPLGSNSAPIVARRSVRRRRSKHLTLSDDIACRGVGGAATWCFRAAAPLEGARQAVRVRVINVRGTTVSFGCSAARRPSLVSCMSAPKRASPDVIRSSAPTILAPYPDILGPYPINQMLGPPERAVIAANAGGLFG